MGNFTSVLFNIPYQGYRGTCRWVKWSYSFLFLIFRKRSKRLFQYDLAADCQPFKTGFFIPPEEWDLECLSDKQENDEMFFFGVNSSGECLALQISRECACDSSCSLFLKSNECTYTLPVKSDYLITTDRKVFGSNRFYVKCLAPFRKWKIFFNGMLRETKDKEMTEKDQENHDHFIHARFSLIWVASSGVFDFVSDYSCFNMADILSDIKWNSLRPPIKRILSILDEYHQPGMMHGTIQIGSEPEQEVVLWGCRRHAFGIRDDDFVSRLELFGNIENGLFFYFKIMSIQNSAVARNTSGYIMQPNGSLNAVRLMSTSRININSKNILFFSVKSGGLYFTVSVFIYGYGGLFGKGVGENMAISIIDVLVNNVWGSGIVIERRRTKKVERHRRCREISAFLKRSSALEISLHPLVVTLEDPICLNKTLTGNLGSTLAKIMQLEDQISGYCMPPGFVITTISYEEHFDSVQKFISLLKENILKYDMDELMHLCDKIVEEISNSFFPSGLYDPLCDNLDAISEYEEKASFNIFPSVIGPDVEVQLLEAYLIKCFYVVGVAQVAKCIKKCWASQFSFTAIQCKRSTGLSLNVPMAIVIQKTLLYDISGVISTCESSSGNPSILEIRETKDKACPEAVCVTRLKRDFKNHLSILDGHIVHSEKKINKINDSNKSNDTKTTAPISKAIALSDDQILSLGRLACKMENSFHYPLGIEWCFRENKFLIIQARPVIFTNSDSRLEILHYYDTYTRSEDDWFSSCNIGESFVGPISPLGMNLINFCIEVFVDKLKCITSDLWDPQMPYFPKFLIFSHYHLLYCLADGILRFYFSPDSYFFQSLPFIMDTKISVENLLSEFISKRHKRSISLFKMLGKTTLVLLLYYEDPKKYKENIVNLDFNLKNVNSACDILDILSLNYQNLTRPFVCFMICTYRAILWSTLVFSVLRKNAENKRCVYRDFNYLMSAYSVTEDGDIALDVMALANRISQNINTEVFGKMSIEDVKVWLEDTEIDKKVKFSDFLKIHGHRSYKETDIFEKCWNMDPTFIIRALQTIVSNTPLKFVPPSYLHDDVFRQLSVKRNYFQKLILKYALPKCVESLKEAKQATSNLLRVASFWRCAFHQLSNSAVREFRIPFPQALFFMTLDEMNHVLREESPHLVSKALKCWEIRSDLEKYVFPVMSVGYPFPLPDNFYDKRRLKVGSYLEGCPMSRGTVVGHAVIVRNVSEIPVIEKGSILITRSPSIVWSLYFSVLGGFATDLGGVLSDGAVAARDYGLPCVINLIRASHVLETGDRVFLDSNVGILRRISD